jgi:hypothetical protein
LGEVGGVGEGDAVELVKEILVDLLAMDGQSDDVRFCFNDNTFYP